MRYLFTLLLISIPTGARARITVSELQNLLEPIKTGSFSVESLFGKIFDLLILIAAILATVYLVWAGIQFITAAGDPEKAKKARDAIFHAIIGIVVIVLSYAIIAWTRALVNEGLNGSDRTTSQQSSTEQANSRLAGSIPGVGNIPANQGSSTGSSQIGQPGPLITSGFADINYSTNGFSPANIQVRSGTLVTFKNSTNSTAELMAYPGANSNPELNIGTLSGQQLSMQRQGTWRYYNPLNPKQQGVITVK